MGIKERFKKKEETKMELPGEGGKGKVLSREYKIYKEEEEWASIPRTFYENACKLSEKIVHISPDPITKEKIKQAIEFSHLNVTPAGVASLTIIVAFIISAPTFILLLTDLIFGFGLELGLALLVIFLSIPFAYYLYIYPLHLEKRFKIRVGSDMISMILYMSVYMRENPNLEGAVKFSAENIEGSLAYELRKILWDVEVGVFSTIDEALRTYMSKWSADKSFIEAIELLKNSLNQPEAQRLRMIDESIELIIESANEAAEKYNRDLKMPILLINAMGILLPVMGLVMFPIIAVFLNIGPAALFIGYDIILPIVLLFIITQILENRMPTFGRVQIRGAEAIPKGKFMVKTYHGKRFLPVLPVSLLAATIVIFIAYLLSPSDFIQLKFNFNQSIVFIFAGVVAISSYNILSSQQRMKLRQRVRSIESEFTESLFQLGNKLSTGIPVENAISFVVDQIGAMEIKRMFSKIQKNIRQMGMTFEEAIFNKKYGAIINFPSKSINSIMKIIVESTKKSSKTAAVGILSISKYMRNIHRTQEHIKNELNDVITSVKFQLMLLTPFISGIIVGLTVMIIEILQKISDLSTSFGSVATPLSFIGMINDLPITIDQFQIIVGIYFIESTVLLAMFVNGVENGEDPIGKQNLTGYAMLLGFIVYIATLIISMIVFKPLVGQFITM